MAYASYPIWSWLSYSVDSLAEDAEPAAARKGYFCEQTEQIGRFLHHVSMNSGTDMI